MISMHTADFLFDKDSLNPDRLGSMSGNVNLILCRECGYWCTSVEDLQSHCLATKHHTFYTTSPSQGFLCRLCQVSLDSLDTIREHAASTSHNMLHPKSQPLPNNVQLTVSSTSSCLDNQLDFNQTSSNQLDLGQPVHLSSTASSLSVLSNTACLNEPDTEDLVVQDEISSDTPPAAPDLVECGPEFLVQDVDQLEYDTSKADPSSIRNRFTEDEDENDTLIINKTLDEASLRCSRFPIDEESGFNDVVAPPLNNGPLLSDQFKNLVCTSCGLVCPSMQQANVHASQTQHIHFTPLVDDQDEQMHDQRVDLYNGNANLQSHDQFGTILMPSNSKLFDNQCVGFSSKSFMQASSSILSHMSAKGNSSLNKDIRGPRGSSSATSRATKTNRKTSTTRNSTSKSSQRNLSMSPSVSLTRNNKDNSVSSNSVNRSPNHERNTGLTICVQCGKWIASSAGSAAANQHTAETGHRLLLPVKLKGEQTEFRCLVCSESLKRSHQVALHIVYTGHDQFASVCASSVNTPSGFSSTESVQNKAAVTRASSIHPDSSRSPINNRILPSPTRQTSGYLTDESSPSHSQIVNSNDDVLLATNKPHNGSTHSFSSSPSTSESTTGTGSFSCNYCSMRLTKSSQLPDHHSRTGHARFTKIVTCATGVAIETWNQSGRMIRGEVLPNKETTASSTGLYPDQVDDCLASSRVNDNDADSNDVPRNCASLEDPSKSGNLIDLVTSALKKNSLGAKLNAYRSISLFIAADMQHEVDVITQQLHSYSNPLLHRPLVHCAICNLSFASFRLLVSHVAALHSSRRDILDKMAYFVRIELNCPEEVDLLVSYACLLCTTYNFQAESTNRFKVSANTEAGQINASFVFSCASALPEHVGTWHCLVCPLCRRVHLKLSSDQKTPPQCCQQYVLSSASSSKASSLRSPPDSSSSCSPTRKRQKRLSANSSGDDLSNSRKRKASESPSKTFKWQSNKYLKISSKSTNKLMKQSPKQQLNAPPVRHRRNSTISRQ